MPRLNRPQRPFKQRALLLQKTGADGQEAEQDRLTVRRISGPSLASAHIAFLSACSTDENEVARLSGEG